MSITAKPWKGASGKFQVSIYFKWPSGEAYRDRKVIDAKTEKAAVRWGEQRQAELLAKGQRNLDEVRIARNTSRVLVRDWYATYYNLAETGEVGRKNQGKGQTAIQDRRDRFRLWIEPTIGHLMMGQVTPENMRAIVRMLDDQIRRRIRYYEDGAEADDRVIRGGKSRKPGLSSKTAAHIWSECTSGFREALSSKLDELRVITVDPTAGVQPPLKTKPREQEALFPSEVVQLLACEAIPLERRRIYAFALYTAMRRSELERATAAHVNFEHQTIMVMGSKTDAASRQIPIEPALLPLLKRLVKEHKTGALVEVPSGQGSNGTADLMRLDLERAQLTRAALFRDDAHVMPFNFHALRHTAITHWAVAGKSQLFLLTVAGHMDVQMTKRYLGKAASVSAKFGTPHPPLPPKLLGGAEVVRLAARRSA